jgi:uncharacterized protein (TIGR04255 family)
MSLLPDFEKPPVIEVVISLQFQPLEALRSCHLGIYWQNVRAEGFSRTEDHLQLMPAFEDFEARPSPKVGVRFQAFDDAPPLPRVWFLNETQSELIQVQRDRLIVNWRQGASPEPYPHYVSIIERFKFALKTFSEFVSSENLGTINPTQCEVTYVNHISTGVSSNHSDLDHLVTMWRHTYSDSYLSKPEDVGFSARYRMEDEQGNPVGRLHVDFQPAYRNTDGRPIFVMNLTARGKPEPADLGGAFRLFDREHEWIVRGFTSMTTQEMHALWGKKNGHS